MKPFTGLFCVDAFSDRIGSGNPAGVCLLEEKKDPAWMQVIAREMNHSETAFLTREKDGFSLCWFTPRAEIELAGHPTLAAAHILWEEGFLKNDEPARFFTKSGELSARKEGELVELDFPAVVEEPAFAPLDLVGSLGVQPCYTGRNRYDWLLEVETEEEVCNLHPDFGRLTKIPMRGVIVDRKSVV